MAPAQLGIAAAPTVRVWEVQCNGRTWTVPGAQLVEQRPGRLLAAWDGAFYTLARRPAADTTAAPTTAARVRGTATYRERMALPPDAVFEATLHDVSRADAPALVLGRARVERSGNPPFRFEIPYDTAAVDARHAYAVRARVTLGDRRLFTTTDVVPVLTRGHGREVALVLRLVPGR